MKERHPVECGGTCGRMIRPTRTTETEHPDTLAYYAAGMCWTCHAAYALVTPERVSYVRRELSAYLRSRGRTIPEELSKAVS